MSVPVGREPAESVSPSGEPTLRVAVVEHVAEGGRAHFADSFCTALADAGADVCLFTSSRYEFAGQPRPFKVDRGMRLWPAFEERRDATSRARRTLSDLHRRLRRAYRAARLGVEQVRVTFRVIASEPDVVQLSSIDVRPIATWTRRRFRSRGLVVVDLIHEPVNRERRGGRRRPRRAARPQDREQLADAFVVLSEAVRDVLLHDGVDPDQIALIRHGAAPIGVPDPALVEELHGRYAPDGQPIVLTWGTIRPSKGIPVLLDAVARMPADLRFVAVIAGYPTNTVDPGALRRQVARLGIADRVVLDFRYLPDVELASLLAVTDLVVLPYSSATQSGVMHCAFAQGVPVLATRVGGLREAITDGVDGRLVLPDDPAELAIAMTALLRDPSGTAHMGRRAQRRAEEEASWDAAGRAALAAYHRWLIRREQGAGRGS